MKIIVQNIGLKFCTRPGISGEEISKLHRPQCSSATYFNDQRWTSSITEFELRPQVTLSVQNVSLQSISVLWIFDNSRRRHHERKWWNDDYWKVLASFDLPQVVFYFNINRLSMLYHSGIITDKSRTELVWIRVGTTLQLFSVIIILERDKEGIRVSGIVIYFLIHFTILLIFY